MYGLDILLHCHSHWHWSDKQKRIQVPLKYNSMGGSQSTQIIQKGGTCIYSKKHTSTASSTTSTTKNLRNGGALQFHLNSHFCFLSKKRPARLTSYFSIFSFYNSLLTLRMHTITTITTTDITCQLNRQRRFARR